MDKKDMFTELLNSMEEDNDYYIEINAEKTAFRGNTMQLTMMVHYLISSMLDSGADSEDVINIFLGGLFLTADPTDESFAIAQEVKDATRDLILRKSSDLFDEVEGSISEFTS